MIRSETAADGGGAWVPPRRTLGTNMGYFHEHTRLRRAAAREGVAAADHLRFAQWLIASRTRVAWGSWRRMRAAALFGLDLEGCRAARDAEALLRRESATGAAADGASGRRPPRARAGSDGDLALMLAALAEHAGRARRARCSPEAGVAAVAASWLRAGRALGLRPGQWRGARLDSADAAGGPYLRLRNDAAGGASGRAGTAEYRRIDLSPLAPGDRQAVAALVSALAMANDAGELRRRCTELLSRLSARLWARPRQALTLDNCRRGSRGQGIERAEGRKHK